VQQLAATRVASCRLQVACWLMLLVASCKRDLLSGAAGGDDRNEALK